MKEIKIRIYKLERCSFCKRLIEELKKESIPFKEIDVDDPDNTGDCTRLEAFFESQRYPKLIIEKKGITIFLNYLEGKRVTNFGDNIFEYFNNVEEVVSTIKKHYYEI